MRLFHTHNVFYICGSDEHGVAITLSAEMAGRSPKQHVDHFHKILKDFFTQLEFSFDHYSRTTWEGHVETTTQYFRDLLENGFIEERVTQQLYSEQDKRFLADRYVVGTCPKCAMQKRAAMSAKSAAPAMKRPISFTHALSSPTLPLILKPTKHWFLLFDRFKDELTTWISKKQWKPNVVKFAQNYIDDLAPVRSPAILTGASPFRCPVPRESFFTSGLTRRSVTSPRPKSGPKKKELPKPGKITGAILIQNLSSSSAKTTSRSTPSFSCHDHGTKAALQACRRASRQ